MITRQHGLVKQIALSKRSICAGAVHVDGRTAITATCVAAFDSRPIEQPFRVRY